MISTKIGWGILALCLGLNFLLLLIAQRIWPQGFTDGWRISTLTPDKITFAIWGPIYLLHICSVGIQFKHPYPNNWRCLGLNFLLNGAWCLVNGAIANDGVGGWWVSAAVILLNAYVLNRCYQEVDYTGIGACAPRVFLVNAAISLNYVWITIASALCVTNTLFDDTLPPSQPSIGSADWTKGVLFVVACVAVYYAVAKRDLVYSTGVLWTVAGIHRRGVVGQFPLVLGISVTGLLVLFLIGSFIWRRQTLTTTPTTERKLQPLQRHGQIGKRSP